MAFGYEYNLRISKEIDAEGLRSALVLGMQEIVLTVAERAQAAMPRRFVPLLRAIVEDPGPGQAVIGIVALPKSRKGQDTFLARFAETGTKPHEIRPSRRGRRMLRFEVGGRVVFTRRVNHPGMPARPWLQPAFEGTDIERIMLDAITRDEIRGTAPAPAERGTEPAGMAR